MVCRWIVDRGFAAVRRLEYVWCYAITHGGPSRYAVPSGDWAQIRVRTTQPLRCDGPSTGRDREPVDERHSRPQNDCRAGEPNSRMSTTSPNPIGVSPPPRRPEARASGRRGFFVRHPAPMVRLEGDQICGPSRGQAAPTMGTFDMPSAPTAATTHTNKHRNASGTGASRRHRRDQPQEDTVSDSNTIATGHHDRADIDPHAPTTHQGQ